LACVGPGQREEESGCQGNVGSVEGQQQIASSSTEPAQEQQQPQPDQSEQPDQEADQPTQQRQQQTEQSELIEGGQRHENQNYHGRLIFIFTYFDIFLFVLKVKLSFKSSDTRKRQQKEEKANFQLNH
jgi:flagellar motor protein MotB